MFYRRTLSPTSTLRALALAGVCLAGALGCRNDRVDTSVNLLERENRKLEDVIWAWKDAYDEKCRELESCQRALDTMQRERADDDGPAGLGADDDPLDRRAPANGTDPPDLDALPEGPLVEPPDFNDSEALPNPALPATPSGLRRPVDEPEVDARVTEIALNPRLTGGYDFREESPGDDGLMVVVEPRNADGQYVALPGTITVVLLDPELEGAEARVARWEFTAAEAAERLRKTIFGPGVQLELPWPGPAPRNAKLIVAVRYTTVDGRKLEARKEIKIDVPPAGAGQWTPSGSGGAEGSASSEDAAEPEPLPTAPAEPLPSAASERGGSRSVLVPSAGRRGPDWSPLR